MSDRFAAPPSSATAAELWDRCVGLKPVPKLVLRLKSLIVPFASKTDFVACLQATKIRPPDDTAWRATAVTLELEAPRAAKLLTETFTCPSSLLHRVAEDAAGPLSRPTPDRRGDPPPDPAIIALAQARQNDPGFEALPAPPAAPRPAVAGAVPGPRQQSGHRRGTVRQRPQRHEALLELIRG